MLTTGNAAVDMTIVFLFPFTLAGLGLALLVSVVTWRVLQRWVKS